MSYLHIKSSFNCLVKIDTFEKTLDKNKTYSFLTHDETLTIIVYPLLGSSSSLPFCFKFDSQNPICKKNVDVIKFPNENYLILLSPFYIGSPKYLGVKTKTLNFGGTSHTLYYVLNSNFNIKLENEFSSCEHTFLEKISSMQTKTIENNVLIYAKLSSNLGYVFCNINYENNTFTLITLEKVNLLENKTGYIYTYKKLNDISHHGEVKKFSLNPPYNQTSYIVYDKNSLVIIKHKELIPFAFFEAVKLENYKLAKSYMSKALSQKLSNAHLKKFFGDFLYPTLPLAKDIYEDEISLVYTHKNEKGEEEKYAKNYKIVINNNNKIDNIFEE